MGYSTDLAIAKVSNDSAHTVDSTYSFNLSAAFTQDVRDPALSSPGLFPFPPGHTAQPHLPASACSEVGLRDQMLTRGKWQLMGDPSKLGHFSLRHSGFSTRSPSLFAEDPAEDSKTLGDGTARWCKDPRCLNSCREVSPPGPTNCRGVWCDYEKKLYCDSHWDWSLFVTVRKMFPSFLASVMVPPAWISTHPSVLSFLIFSHFSAYSLNMSLSTLPWPRFLFPHTFWEEAHILSWATSDELRSQRSQCWLLCAN